jgi:zinc protease
MEKARNNLLARVLFSCETTYGTADRIAQFDAARDWRLFGVWPDRIKAVTADQVKAVAAKYLLARNRTVGWSVSPEQAALAVPVATPPGGEASVGGPGKPEAGPEAEIPPEAPAMARKAAPPEEPDTKPTFRGGRRSAPEFSIPSGPAGEVRIAPRVEKLPNGLTVLLQRHGTLPVLACNLYVPAGQLVEAKPGLAYLAGDLLDEGAGDRTTEQIAETLDFLGAALHTDANGARAKFLAKDTDAVLDLLADVVLRPRFDAEEIEKCRQSHLSEIAAADDDPGTVGRKAFLKAIYGDHPNGRMASGDVESVKSLSREDIVEHHRRWFVPDRAVLAVTGDFDPDAILAALRKRFGDWKPGGTPRPALPEVKPLPEPRRVDCTMEGKTQSNVFIGNVGIRRSDPDWVTLLVLDHILGTAPGFSDRLSKDLRDEQGLAYTVSGNGSRSAGEEPGTWTGFIGCLGNDLPKAIEGVMGHVRRIREEPVTDQELADAKSYLIGSQVFRYETTDQVAGELVYLQRFGLGFDYPVRLPSLVDAVTKEDVLRVAKRILQPDRMAVVVSGYTGSEAPKK